MPKLAALVGWVLLLSACAQEAPDKTVALPDYGLSLVVPESWQVQESAQGLRLLVRPVDRAGAVVHGAYLTLARDEKRTGAPTADLASYVQFKEQQAQRYVQRYERLVQDRLRLQGIEAVRQERLYASRTQEKRALALMVVRGDFGYTVVGAAPPRDYATLRPQFERVLASVRWQ